MTGFEVAGLVLAVLPLVKAALDAYPDPIFAKITGAAVERREFARQLQMVQAQLRNAMLRVFMRIDALLTDDQWRNLTHYDVKGSQFFAVWDDILKANPDAIKTKFESTIEDIKFVINDMVIVLSKVMRETKIAADPGPELLRKIIQNDKDDKTFSIPKNFISRFKFARSWNKRSKLSKQMERNIAQLNLLNDTQDLIEKLPSTKTVRESHAQYLDRVRCYSNSLYHALFKVWRCKCHISPSAMLRLEKRMTPEPKEANTLLFSLILTFEHCFSPSHQPLWAFQNTKIYVDQK
jgi:hypothetical protein